MSFALVLKKTSWYRRRYSRPLRVKLFSTVAEKCKKFFPDLSLCFLTHFVFGFAVVFSDLLFCV